MLSKRIKNMIIKNDRLYVIVRRIKSINNSNYWKLVKGCFEVCNYASILIEHKGDCRGG